MSCFLTRDHKLLDMANDDNDLVEWLVVIIYFNILKVSSSNLNKKKTENFIDLASVEF